MKEAALGLGFVGFGLSGFDLIHPAPVPFRPPANVVGFPDLAHGEPCDRLRKIGQPDDLLNALTADTEQLADLGRADQVMHVGDHRHKTTSHLTRGLAREDTSHVTSARLGPNPRHPKYGGKRCWHFGYGMTCEEFDVLYELAKGCCQICQKPEHLVPRGVLHIDHYHAHPHAVRGLLCSVCNGMADYVSEADDPNDYVDSAWYAKAQEYHRNAWYKRPESRPLGRLPGPRMKYGQIQHPLTSAGSIHIVTGGWKQGNNYSACRVSLWMPRGTPSEDELCIACVAEIEAKPYLDYRPF